MARGRAHSTAFKRQVAEEYHSREETLRGLVNLHDICQALIRNWVAQYETGEFDEEIEAATVERTKVIWLPIIRLRSAALRRSINSRKFSSCTLNKKFFTQKERKDCHVLWRRVFCC